MNEDVSSIDWAAIATFCAVLVALGVGIYNGWRAKVLEKNRNKRELLKEIADWAISLHIGPLKVELPPTNMAQIQKLKFEGYPEAVINELEKSELNRFDAYIEFQKKMSFGKSIALNEYIRAITTAHFKEQLLNQVNDVIEKAILNHFVSDRAHKKEFDIATKGFGGKYIEIMQRVENEEINKTKDLEGLANKYAEHLTNSINNLLGEIAKITA